MNVLTTFVSLKVSKYDPTKDKILYVYGAGNGDVVRFRGSCKVWDNDSKSFFWQKFNFIAYDAIAEQVKKMNMQAGSYVCIVAEQIFTNLEALENADAETIKKLSSIWYKVININYVEGIESPEKRKSRGDAVNGIKDPFLAN